MAKPASLLPGSVLTTPTACSPAEAPRSPPPADMPKKQQYPNQQGDAKLQLLECPLATHLRNV